MANRRQSMAVDGDTDQSKELNLVVLGAAETGKSWLIHRLVASADFDIAAPYDSTIEDTYVKSCLVDEQSYQLNILDTGGGELAGRQEAWIARGNAFLVVFSVADRASLQKARELLAAVKKLKPSDALLPMQLVGNKTDMGDSREVSFEDGEELAKQYKIHYLEVSAKENDNVEAAFYEIVRTARKLLKEGNKKDKKCVIM